MINFITYMGYPFMLWNSFGLSLVSFYLNGRQHTVAGKHGARHTALAQKKNPRILHNCRLSSNRHDNGGCKGLVLTDD